MDYQIKHDFHEMDFDKVTLLLEKAFWSVGIKKEEIIKGAEHSALLVGVFNNTNEQIGYARVISDKTRFAYILDVIVDDAFQKKGIGQAMMNFILHHEELKTVYQWLLITKDAHGVYNKVGFNPVARPKDWMEIRNLRP
jgi:GNAT superfamily N-acetyltransferase